MQLKRARDNLQKAQKNHIQNRKRNLVNKDKLKIDQNNRKIRRRMIWKQISQYLKSKFQDEITAKTLLLEVLLKNSNSETCFALKKIKLSGMVEVFKYFQNLFSTDLAFYMKYGCGISHEQYNNIRKALSFEKNENGEAKAKVISCLGWKVPHLPERKAISKIAYGIALQNGVKQFLVKGMEFGVEIDFEKSLKSVCELPNFQIPNDKIIHVQILADGFRAMRSGMMTNIGFRVLRNNCDINSCASVEQIFILEDADNYHNMQRPLTALNQAQPKFISFRPFEKQEVETCPILYEGGGDMKFISEILGLGGVFSGSSCNCPWCECPSTELHNLGATFPLRTIESITFLSHSPVFHVFIILVLIYSTVY